MYMQISKKNGLPNSCLHKIIKKKLKNSV